MPADPKACNAWLGSMEEEEEGKGVDEEEEEEGFEGKVNEDVTVLGDGVCWAGKGDDECKGRKGEVNTPKGLEEEEGEVELADEGKKGAEEERGEGDVKCLRPPKNEPVGKGEGCLIGVISFNGS